ncbi:MAG TPA: hypothetical protein VEU08_03640 [Vicinamibacterales bacterium]|nr:hypothetical protein [Vicinamibacterales bacterium]
MATLAFLLAPQRAVPDAHDEQWFVIVASWLHIANWKWTELWEALPADQRAAVPRFPLGTGLSTNMMDARARKEPQLIASAQPWTERVWNDWQASGRHWPPPSIDSASVHEALRLDSKMSLANLTGYSGGFTAVPAARLKRGGAHAFVKNDGDANAFAFGEDDSTQRALFLEVARGHGGDHVAVWTFGHALHALVARSAAPGARPTLYGPFSVRARVAGGAARPGGFVEALAAALAGSAIAPDFDALRKELAKPELSVAACFQAFGLPGARDFASPDIASRWNDFESVARALLTGGAVDKKLLKNVNDELEPLQGAKLPSKSKPGKGEVARLVAGAAVDLKGGMGVPESGPSRERFRAAAIYWDICDGAALDRLTTGSDKGGVGTGASIARLLAHFPETLPRDPLFLSTLALECEAANGHAYVDGLFKLAEQTTTASLVLVAAAADQRASMRKAFGVADGEAAPDGTRCGEALIGGTTVAKGDASQIARAWAAKARLTGAVADLAADGGVTIDYYRDGAATNTHKDAGLGAADQKALQHAAKAFSPRAAFVALGAGDVLAPGEWREGSYAGEAALGEDHRAKKRRHADRLAASAVESTPVARFSDLLAGLRHRSKYSGPLHENDGGFVTIRVTPGVDDESWSRLVRNDLKGKGMIDRYGDAWLNGTEIRGYSCSSVETELVVQLLGDAPRGTALAIWVGPNLKGAWRIV